MVMKIRRLLAGVLLAAGILACGMVSPADEAPSLEQVYVNMPEVMAYGQGVAGDVAEANLGKEKLEYIGSTPFSQTGQSVYYYVLLDVSNSMPAAYFNAIKQSIVNFESTLKPNDRMALYTFGEQVELKLPEEHTPADTQQAMETIRNADNRTLLFEAISMAADRAEQVQPDVCKRKVLIVISDGEDFTIGGTGAQEAQENLKRKGIPAYAYAIKDTARANINNFGEFARTSGGQLTIFDAQQAATLLDGLVATMDSFEVMEFRAQDNFASNSMETFTIKTHANQTITRDVLVFRHIPDETAPTILRADKVADDQVEVEFSEPVKGADVAASYTVTRKDLKKDKGSDDEDTEETEEETEEESEEETEDETEEETEEEEEDEKNVAAVAGVSVNTENPNVVVLTFANELKPGEYTITCTNIYDISMEGNAVANTAVFEVEQYPLSKRILMVVQQWYWVFLVLLALLVILTIFLVYRKVKKGRGVIYVDGKPVIASEVEVHKHVAIQKAQEQANVPGGKTFHLRVSVKGGPPQEMNLRLAKSFIVGRSKICNLYFDDNRMSRQHFALEWDGMEMYVSDLNTTNGTMVNNVKINKKRRLQQGDKISAGSVEMTIGW